MRCAPSALSPSTSALPPPAIWRWIAAESALTDAANSAETAGALSSPADSAAPAPRRSSSAPSISPPSARRRAPHARGAGARGARKADAAVTKARRQTERSMASSREYKLKQETWICRLLESKT